MTESAMLMVPLTFAGLTVALLAGYAWFFHVSLQEESRAVRTDVHEAIAEADRRVFEP
jgi:hypothetical protein